MGGIAGKVMIRPRGDYDPSAVYNILDLVKHDNKPWLCCRNNIMGITPNYDNRAEWMNIIDISIANADTLDGHDSTYFAKADHKHTARELAALPLTAGADVPITGDLYFQKVNNGSSRIYKNHSATLDLGLQIIDTLADGTTVKLIVSANPDQIPLGLVIGDNGYSIYGTHNKPTAADVGARPNTWMPTASDVGAVPDIYMDWRAYTDIESAIKAELTNVIESEETRTFCADIAGGTPHIISACVRGTVITGTYSNYNSVFKYFRKDTNGTWYFHSIYGEHNKPTAADIGAASSSHTHGAGDINSGTLGVARGGTGATTFTSGAALIGAGTDAVTTRAITNNTSGAVASGTNLATCNTVNNHSVTRLNRTTSVNAADTSYTAHMARGIALNTAVPSSLTNGCVTFVYA